MSGARETVDWHEYPVTVSAAALTVATFHYAPNSIRRVSERTATVDLEALTAKHWRPAKDGDDAAAAGETDRLRSGIRARGKRGRR